MITTAPPLMTGAELWQRLKEDDGFSDLPVVVGLVTAAGALGAALATLTWTDVATALKTAISSAMQKAGGTAAPAAPPPGG